MWKTQHCYLLLLQPSLRTMIWNLKRRGKQKLSQTLSSFTSLIAHIAERAVVILRNTDTFLSATHCFLCIFLRNGNVIALVFHRVFLRLIHLWLPPSLLCKDKPWTPRWFRAQPLTLQCSLWLERDLRRTVTETSARSRGETRDQNKAEKLKIPHLLALIPNVVQGVPPPRRLTPCSGAIALAGRQT